MKTTNKHIGKARRESVLWITLFVFMISFLGYGFILFVRHLDSVPGLDPDRSLSAGEIVIAMALAVIVTVILIYAAGIIWLLLVKRFFTKEEVSKIFFHGPTSSFDRRLFENIFRPEKIGQPCSVPSAGGDSRESAKSEGNYQELHRRIEHLVR